MHGSDNQASTFIRLYIAKLSELADFSFNVSDPHDLAFISEPSKTADIELNLVIGANRARGLMVYVIAD